MKKVNESVKLKIGQPVLDEQGREYRVTEGDTLVGALIVEGQDAVAKKIAKAHDLNPKHISMWADKLNVNLAKSIKYLVSDDARVGLVNSLATSQISTNLDRTQIVSLKESISLKEGKFNPKWEDEAKKALEEKLDVEVERTSNSWVEDYDGISFESVSGRGSNGESEWIVFKSEDDAKRLAISEVRQNLEDEPEIFTPSWLENFIYISDTDKRMLADEEVDYYFEDRSDKEVIEEEGKEKDYSDIEEKIKLARVEREELDENDDSHKKNYLEATRKIENFERDLEDFVTLCKDALASNKYDELIKALEDPIEYFVKENGIYTMSDIMDQNFIRIDVEEASKDAVETDGIAHFLDRYNGEEEELDGGFLAYGTN